MVQQRRHAGLRPKGVLHGPRTLSDGTTLARVTAGKVVSRIFLGQESFYVQEQNRSCGILVHDPYTVL